jgi:uncharacterized protein (TIGR00369 family)
MDGFANWIGVKSEGSADGSAELQLDAQDNHLNPAGTVHGGVLATLVDTAMGLAVRSSTDEGEIPATSQLTITYLRPARAGLLSVRAEVRKQGEHLLVCDADVEQDGRPIAHAIATFALVSR